MMSAEKEKRDNCVVTKDIPENSLAVGNPCRVVRKLCDN